MGRDKAGLLLHGRTLLDHAHDRLREAGFAPVRVGLREAAGESTATDSCAAIVEDAFPDSGPAAGLHAALASLDGERQQLALFTPVDLPLLPAGFLCRLWDRAQSTGAAATVPTLGGRPQPLCAVYAVALAPALRERVAAGERKVMHIVEQSVAPASFDLFAVEALAPLAGWSGVEHWFTNLNTPADWAWMTAGRSRAGSHRI